MPIAVGVGRVVRLGRGARVARVARGAGAMTAVALALSASVTGAGAEPRDGVPLTAAPASENAAADVQRTAVFEIFGRET